MTTYTTMPAMREFIAHIRNRFIVLLADVLMIPIAWFGAYWIRFNLGYVPHNALVQAAHVVPVVIVVQAIAFWLFGLYRGIWRFASLPDLIRIIKAVIVGTLIILFLFFVAMRLSGIPRSVLLLYPWLLVSLLTLARITFRLMKGGHGLFAEGKRVLIVGAGEAAERLLRELAKDTVYQPVVLVDDDPKKQGREIHGVRVGGNISDIPQLLSQHGIELVIIAIPSMRATLLRKVVDLCETANVTFRIVPGLDDVVSGRVNINVLRDVSLEDLLGREPISLDWQRMSEGIGNKRVLISGGGGSIGSELCRQVARLGAASLIVVDNSEFHLYEIDRELKRLFPDLALSVYMADVTDRVAMDDIMRQHRPHIVFHAAAYKHVPLLESQVRVAVRNNVWGTHCLATVAVAHDVETFVLISTDKAVHPTNIMGATKRAAEVVCQWFNQQHNTHFITVRFGNVLGSRGSVVPLFKAQLKQGGPLTVTHPEITRYFMTIPEATQLILQVSVIGKGGELFVLDMGEPIAIRYLAEQVIRLSGKEPGTDIEIIYTGLRPGEKLHEELFYNDENVVPTVHKQIFKVESNIANINVVAKKIVELEKVLNTATSDKILMILKELVPELQTDLWNA